MSNKLPEPICAFLISSDGTSVSIPLPQNFDDFTEGELNFMEYFIRDRLKDEQFRFEIIEELPMIKIFFCFAFSLRE